MDIKDIKKMSYDEIDAAISNRQAEIEANISKMKPFQDEISRLEFEIKNLCEVKSQKIIDDSKQSIVDSKIDFSLEEFQQFLLSKKVSEKNLKAKSAKKMTTKFFRHQLPPRKMILLKLWMKKILSFTLMIF